MNNLTVLAPIQETWKQMDALPILGRHVLDNHNDIGKVYTRTIVLWAYGITVDPQQLWENVEVRDRADGPVITKEDTLQPTEGAVLHACPRALRTGLYIRKLYHRDHAFSP
jgi:hypothetical protein